MLACSHYKRFGLRTYIRMSDGHPWNAWVTVYDEAGNIYYSGFETGLFWEYVDHLAQSPDCAREVGEDISEVKKILNTIQTEWESQGHSSLDDFKYTGTLEFPVYPATEVPGHERLEGGINIFASVDKQIAYDIARRIGGKVITSVYNNTIFLLVSTTGKCILVSEIDKRALLSQVKKLSI